MTGLNINEINDEAKKLVASGENKSEEVTGRHLLLRQVTEIPFLVEPFLQQSGLACLAGSSDTGKSSILRQLAVAVVTGQPDFIGFKINALHHSVIYVSTEDLERETAYLLSRQSRRYVADDLSGLRFVFDTTDLLKELHIRLTRQPADMVIVDCFADVYGNDLKDTQKIRTFLNDYQQLAQIHECLVLFLHHTGKRTENFTPSKNNLLSGQGFEAKMRLVAELRVDQVNPNNRHLCIVKGNYLPAHFKNESYVLQFNEQQFTYTNTGQRVPFDMLLKADDNDSGKAKFEQASELKQQGCTYDYIAKAIGYHSKSSVSSLFEKAKRQGWTYTATSTASLPDEETPAITINRLNPPEDEDENAPF